MTHLVRGSNYNYKLTWAIVATIVMVVGFTTTCAISAYHH